MPPPRYTAPPAFMGVSALSDPVQQADDSSQHEEGGGGTEDPTRPLAPQPEGPPMTNPPTRPPAPPLTDDETARLRAIDEAPAAPESFANQRTTGLRNPITRAFAPVYDPAIHGGNSAWLAVTCTRCGRHFVSTPWDELMTPAPELGHTGDVCEPCLYALAHRRVAQ